MTDITLRLAQFRRVGDYQPDIVIEAIDEIDCLRAELAAAGKNVVTLQKNLGAEVRSDREAVIRECAAVVDTLGPEWTHKDRVTSQYDTFTRKVTKDAILALIGGDA